jgi:hypothetical protein
VNPPFPGTSKQNRSERGLVSGSAHRGTKRSRGRKKRRLERRRKGKEGKEQEIGCKLCPTEKVLRATAVQVKGLLLFDQSVPKFNKGKYIILSMYTTKGAA